MIDRKINYKTKTKTILLTITEACNLDCIYCYEDYKSSKVMDFDTAINIINHELSLLPDGITLDVSFMGGEPFLNFALIKEIYDYYESQGISRIKYTCSSNGTLIHGDIKEWIRERFPKFSYNLSFDGIKKVQDYNRSNSFDDIDLQFYVDLYGRGNGLVKMTLHPDTISYLAQSVQYIHALGLYPVVNCAYGVSWTNKDVLIAYKQELLKLIQFYLSHPDIPPCSLLNENLRVLAYETNFKPWCGIDKMTVYDTDGKSYPCHYFQDLTLGEMLSNTIPKFDTEKLLDLMDPVCQSCKLISLCPTCFGSNYKTTGTFGKRDLNVCKTVQIQLYATSIFQLERIKKYGLENLGLSDVEQKELCVGIKTISENIDPDQLF